MSTDEIYTKGYLKAIDHVIKMLEQGVMPTEMKEYLRERKRFEEEGLK